MPRSKGTKGRRKSFMRLRSVLSVSVLFATMKNWVTATEAEKSLKRRRISVPQKDPTHRLCTGRHTMTSIVSSHGWGDTVLAFEPQRRDSVLFRATSCTQAVNDEEGEKVRDSGVICTSTHGRPIESRALVVYRTMLPSRREVPCTKLVCAGGTVVIYGGSSEGIASRIGPRAAIAAIWSAKPTAKEY
jgi:hypothetical protein